MYRFSPNDRAVLFLDCFGATRIELPNKVKTIRTIRGGWDSPVTMSQAGDRALIYDGDWGRLHAFDFPSLKASHKYQRFEHGLSFLLADGTRMLNGEKIIGLDGSPQGALSQTDLQEKPIELWASRDIGYYNQGAFSNSMGTDGTFALLQSHSWSLEMLYGRDDKVLWRRPLKLHGGHRHLFYPQTEGLVVTSLSPGARQVFAAWLDTNGEPLNHFEAQGITLPVRHGATIAWQIDDDQVCVRSDSGDLRKYSISEVTQKAHAQKKHPRKLPKGDFLGDLKNTGPGQLLLGEDAVLFVPWHGETILNLVDGLEIHRKLPAAEHKPRIAFKRRVAWAKRFAQEADILLEGSSCELNAKRPSYWTTVEQTRGEGGFAALLVSAAAAGIFNENPASSQVDEWHWSGGSGGGHDVLSGTFDEAELLRAFSIFDRHEVFLSWSLWGLNSVYGRRLAHATRSSYHGEVMGPPLTKPAEKLLIQAFLESSADAPRYGQTTPKSPSFKLMDRVEAWRAAQLDEASYRAQADKAHHSNIDEGFFDQLATSYFQGGPGWS